MCGRNHIPHRRSTCIYYSRTDAGRRAPGILRQAIARHAVKQTVLELFKTDRKIEFTYDNTKLNYLYMNGVIDREEENRTEYYVKKGDRQENRGKK